MKTVVIEGENGNFTIASHDGRNLAGMSPPQRIGYWQRRGSTAITNAAGKIVEAYCKKNGIDLKLDKSIMRRGRSISEK